MSKHLAHYKTPGAKNGIRNYQSYQTAPTRSGMVGIERGEAAQQRARLARRKQNLNEMSYKNPKQGYNELYTRRHQYSDQEFNDMLRRLDLESKAYQRAHPQRKSNAMRNARDGLKLMSELATAAIGLATVYNMSAYIYNKTKGEKTGKKLPTVPIPSKDGGKKG